jgi:HD-like signal output (HDOD) protein
MCRAEAPGSSFGIREPMCSQEDMRMEDLAQRIASDIDILSDLPSLSPVVAKLSATLGKDDVEVRTIEGIIGQDPVVAGKVIHAANAAAYASHTPTASIHAALLRLGVIKVRRLAMLFGLFNAQPGPRVPEGFWHHSLAVAQLTELVVQHMTVKEDTNTDEVFIAGLLHDLGLLVLATHYPSEYRAIRKAAAVERKPLDEVEDALLGIDHGMIGEILAAHWMLPTSVCAAIRAHHRVDLAGAEYRQNAMIVHVAEAACGHAQLADIGEGVLLRPDDPIAAELGIDPEGLSVILAEAQVLAEEAAELIGFGR